MSNFSRLTRSTARKLTSVCNDNKQQQSFDSMEDLLKSMNIKLNYRLDSIEEKLNKLDTIEAKLESQTGRINAVENVVEDIKLKHDKDILCVTTKNKQIQAKC